MTQLTAAAKSKQAHAENDTKEASKTDDSGRVLSLPEEYWHRTLPEIIDLEKVVMLLSGVSEDMQNLHNELQDCFRTMQDESQKRALEISDLCFRHMMAQGEMSAEILSFPGEFSRSFYRRLLDRR